MPEHALTVKDLSDLYKEPGYQHFPVCIEDEDGKIKPAAFTFYHSFGEGWILEVNSLEYLDERDSHTFRLGSMEPVHNEHTQDTLHRLFNSDWFNAHAFSDVPVFAVKKFCMFQRSFSKVRVENDQLIFYNEKADLDRFRKAKEREDAEWAKSCSGKLPDIALPIVRSAAPRLLADLLVPVKPIKGPLPRGNDGLKEAE